MNLSPRFLSIYQPCPLPVPSRQPSPVTSLRPAAGDLSGGEAQKP